MRRYVSSIVYNVITQTIGNVGFHKIFCLIFPSCAFVEACGQLAAGFDSPSSDYNHTGFNFASVLAIQFANILAYAFLGWYIDKVNPGEYGIPLKWWFFLSPSYWCGLKHEPLPACVTTETSCTIPRHTTHNARPAFNAQIQVRLEARRRRP